jgi:hypothetical protein
MERAKTGEEPLMVLKLFCQVSDVLFRLIKPLSFEEIDRNA